MTISTASKAMIRDVRALKQKRVRDADRRYYAEGISIVLRALEMNAPVESIIYCPELLHSEVALAAVKRASETLPCYEATVAAFESLSGRDNPVGIGAVIAYGDNDPDRLPSAPDGLYVALDDIKSPGNLGTIIRTADGLGFTAVLLAGEATDQYHPECVKASMGTVFSVPVATFPTATAMLDWCAQRGLTLITTSCHARDDITQIPAYPRPAALVMGAEATGLGTETLSAGQLQVRIPMHGSATSLNLAVATGILMYDIGSKPAK